MTSRHLVYPLALLSPLTAGGEGEGAMGEEGRGKGEAKGKEVTSC